MNACQSGRVGKCNVWPVVAHYGETERKRTPMDLGAVKTCETPRLDYFRAQRKSSALTVSSGIELHCPCPASDVPDTLAQAGAQRPEDGQSMSRLMPFMYVVPRRNTLQHKR